MTFAQLCFMTWTVTLRGAAAPVSFAAVGLPADAKMGDATAISRAAAVMIAKPARGTLWSARVDTPLSSTVWTILRLLFSRSVRLPANALEPVAE